MNQVDLAPSEQFHGLLARPFSLTPDLRFTYHSRSHTHAVEQISKALTRREGLVVVTGEVGTGKTMLCRALLDTFEARTFLSVILDPMLTVEDLLVQVLTDFGLVGPADRPGTRSPLGEAGRHDMVATLHKFLASLVPLGAHAVIMIDEAQHLSGPVLEQVRLLSNFETDQAKLLQIVLVGQPDLDVLLEQPDMRQLSQRVARRFELEPLATTEVRDYVERRLFVAAQAPAATRAGTPAESDAEAAGPAPVRFTDEAMNLVAEVSQGIPRLVNTLCDRALDVSFERRSHTVDWEAVRTAATQLKLPVPMGERFSRPRLALAAGLVLAGAALGAWWWVARGTGPAPAVTTPTSVAAPEATPAVPPAAIPAIQEPPSQPAAPAVSAAPPAAPATPPAPSADRPPAPPLNPAASAPAPATGYEITAASFRTEERAASAAATLARSGLPVSSRIDATGQWYRVVVGPFASAEEAQAAQATLEGRGFPGSRISGP